MLSCERRSWGRPPKVERNQRLASEGVDARKELRGCATGPDLLRTLFKCKLKEREREMAMWERGKGGKRARERESEGVRESQGISSYH